MISIYPGAVLQNCPSLTLPLQTLSFWVQTEDARSVSRLSLREARARQATSLEAKAISAGTAMRSECLPAPLGGRAPQGAQFQGPQASIGYPTSNSRVSRPSGTLGGNTLMGIDCMHRIAVSNNLLEFQRDEVHTVQRLFV